MLDTILNINKKISLKTITKIVLVLCFLLSPLSITYTQNNLPYNKLDSNFISSAFQVNIPVANAGAGDFAAYLYQGLVGSTFIKAMFAPMANLMLIFASKALWLAGIVLDYSVNFTLDIKGYVNDTPAVNLAWTAFRDLANMFFIFILLYIAIATILQLNNFDTKRFLTKLIIVALLINFSLFFTNIIIDVSNVLAAGFYSGIVGDTTDADSGISERFMTGLRIQSFYDIKTGATLASIGDADVTLMQGIFGGLLMLITAFTFLAASIMFIIRTAVLMILMILSPLAFAGHILPKTEGYSKEWWNTLFAQSFFAPVYLIMVWVVMKIIEGGITKGDNGISLSAIAGNSNNVAGVLFDYAILIVLIMSALIIAKKVADSGSTTLTNAAGGAIGKVAGGVGGWAGRKFVGGGTAKFLTEERRKRWEKGNVAQRMALKAGRGMTTSSFDVRGIPGASKVLDETGINFGGAGGKGGYLAKQKAAEGKAKEALKSMTTIEEKEAYAQSQNTFISRLLHGKSKKTADKVSGSILKETKKERKEEEIKEEIKEEKKGLQENILLEEEAINKLAGTLTNLNNTIKDTENGVKKTDMIVERDTLIVDIKEREQRKALLEDKFKNVEKKEKENSVVRSIEKMLNKSEKEDGGGESKKQKDEDSSDKKE